MCYFGCYAYHILDLQSVTTKVASSLKEAEMTIQSSIATLSTEELSDDDKENVLKQLGKSTELRLANVVVL